MEEDGSDPLTSHHYEKNWEVVPVGGEGVLRVPGPDHDRIFDVEEEVEEHETETRLSGVAVEEIENADVGVEEVIPQVSDNAFCLKQSKKEVQKDVCLFPLIEVKNAIPTLETARVQLVFEQWPILVDRNVCP